MNDFRRSILWVIFGFSMILLWDQWQIYHGRPATFFPSAPKEASAQASNAPANSASQQSAVPTASTASTSAAPNGNGNATNGQVPAGNAGATSASPAESWIVVTTDVLKLSFDPVGGSLVKAELLTHRDGNDASKHIVLLNDTPQHVYVAQSGLISANTANALPNHKSIMRFEGEKTLATGKNEIQFSFVSENQGGIELTKVYTIKRGQYLIDIQHRLKNTGAQPQQAQVYVQLVRDNSKPLGESSFYSTFTGPAIYSEQKKYQKVEFDQIKDDKASFEKSSTAGYVAMVQHYFSSAWLIQGQQQRDFFARKLDGNLYAVGMIVKPAEIAPGQSVEQQTQLYVGPQEEKKLEAIYPGLELVKDYGWLTILAKPLFWLLDKLYNLVGNWGWAIVLLVVVIKAVFYWLNAKAYRSMAKMKAINPRVMEMRERYKDSPQQMQMEMMKIYREEKVNPLGGCLPIAIQIPVFIALYWVLLSTVEMRDAPWLYITDLAKPDTLFGVLPWVNLPLGPLPILMTLSSLLQTWLNPTPPDPMQAKLMWIMPLLFGIMFFFFPAGLVLYWLTNNVLSIAQQWLINKSMGVTQ
ncbi:MAG: Membrane protein insertase YidC [Pseudomonadota bacterium]|jgi:YidC/Oxa1 family membrane protein insertase